jgi:uncharacterized membrane protein YozB (DUF420 family)
MIGYLEGAGFLRPHSSIGADLSLVIVIVAFAMLTLGVVLARAKHYGAHRWVQTSAVALNAVPVVFWMIRSFRLFVLPGLPGNLSKSIDALTTVHAVTGLIGVVLGVFIVIRANQLAAKGRSLRRYKNHMRTAYVVYLVGTALGVWVYVALYG